MKKILFVLSAILFLFNGCAEKPMHNTIPAIDSVVIALLDTGISTAAIDETRLLTGYNYVDNTEDTNDNINHGTAVASVIVGSASAKIEGIAPDAFLVPLVVTTKDEDGKLQSVTPDILAQAIYDSVDKYGANIINISLGIKKDVPTIKKAVAYAKKQGVMVISAVGNDGEDEDYYYPAAYDIVLAVGSHNNKGELSVFSQQNGTADLLAPGEDIWLASKNGKTYRARGTSYATAYAVAAAAKLLTKAPELSPDEIREILINSATDIALEGHGKKYTVAILDLDEALDYNNDQNPAEIATDDKE
jgi:hypothetical protein